MSSVSTSNWMTGTNWFFPVQEPFTGAWQRNITADPPTSILAFSAVFACVTGIAADIAKMRIKLCQNINGIWEEITKDSPWLSVLRKPNHYQNRIQFITQWIVSKLLYGNAYVLKERDQRGIVRSLYVLHPQCVTILVADDGSVFYELAPDKLSQVEDRIRIPASEIIHDTMVALWHPLVGVSPIYACGISATMGNRIQSNSTSLFGNFSRPGGIVMFPTQITNDQAKEFKQRWEENFSGGNLGRTAILDNGAKFETITMPAQEAQLIEQLKWTVEDVARAFHYPLFKLQMIGGFPPYAAGPEVLSMMYYTDALQTLIESLELCLDEGLELPSDRGTEMDIDNLLRMDTSALFESNNKASDWMKLNEQRQRANLPPLSVGGDTVYKQQQDHSIEAIAKRDSGDDPFGSSGPPTPNPAPPPAEPDQQPDQQRALSPADFEALYADHLTREFQTC